MYPVALLRNPPPPPPPIETKTSTFFCPIIAPSRQLSKSREQTFKKHHVVFTVFTSNVWMIGDKGGNYFGNLRLIHLFIK